MALVTKADLGPKTYSTLYALDSFRNYWNENERLIQKAAELEAERVGRAWIPQTDEEHSEFRWEQEEARRFHDEIMTPTFRYSCIVMLYVIVEREMLRLLKNLEEERGRQKLSYKDLRGSLLEQLSKFAEVFFNLRWRDRPEYAFLCDLQKIRNCIVHCRGDLGLLATSKKQECDYLIALEARRPGFHAWEGLQIDIEAQCIEQFITEAWQFFMWVFNELKWKIGDSWQKMNWPSCCNASTV